VTIDFTTNVTTVVGDPNIIDRIPPATFSHYLQTHPDGFTQYMGGSYNYYGENDELITFDSAVKLVSVDLQIPFLTLPQPTHLHLQMLDSNDVLLAEVVEDPTGAVVTVPFNVGKVKKLVFHFEGGDPTFYGDGRSTPGTTSTTSFMTLRAACSTLTARLRIQHANPTAAVVNARAPSCASLQMHVTLERAIS